MASLFDWFKKEKDTINPTQITRTTPKIVDWTDSMQCNSALTKGLFHNSYPGFKLGGALAYNPIAVPVSFMGLPIPSTGIPNIDEILEQITQQMSGKIKTNHIQSHREGTSWIYPKLSKGKLVWEFIDDDAITDIIRDLSTNEIIQIETREQITVSTGNGNSVIVDRVRIYTKSKVSIKYSGSLPAGLKSTESRNPVGILPIPFANNADGDSVRGNSDYERIITDLKSYHDIDLAEQTILAKFVPKMVVTTKDVEKFATNNGYASAQDMFDKLELSTLDIAIIMEGEAIGFEYPASATESHIKAKIQRFHKIIEASGIPEIAWGLKTEGNMASVEENMAMLMNYVREKREQKNDAYKVLYTASLVLLNQAMLIDQVPEIEISWDRLDNLSEKTKSEILKNFAESLSKLISVAGLTKSQMYRLWVTSYPDITKEEFKEWTTELSIMASHVSETKATLEDRMLLNGNL